MSAVTKGHVGIGRTIQIELISRSKHCRVTTDGVVGDKDDAARGQIPIAQQQGILGYPKQKRHARVPAIEFFKGRAQATGRGHQRLTDTVMTQHCVQVIGNLIRGRHLTCNHHHNRLGNQLTFLQAKTLALHRQH